MLIVCQTQQLHAQQGRFPQVKGLSRARRKGRSGEWLALVLSEILKIDHLQREKEGRRNHLHGMAFTHLKTCAQRFVANKQRLQTALQESRVQLARDAQHHRFVVRHCARRQLFDKPEGFLGKGEGHRLPGGLARRNGAPPPLRALLLSLPLQEWPGCWRMGGNVLIQIAHKIGGSRHPSPKGERGKTAPPFECRFCPAEKDFQVPQGGQDVQACDELVRPSWAKPASFTRRVLDSKPGFALVRAG